MKKYFLIALIGFLSFQHTFAQDFHLTGTIVNAGDQSTLVGATVKLTPMRDTLHPLVTMSDVQGNFAFNNLRRGFYKMNITYVGFKPYDKRIDLSAKSVELGNVILEPSATNLSQVEVIGQAARAEQKGDTSQYNAAAFKVAQDATTEDLVKKMPGITVENGTVKAQGEDIKKVLVDGKAFFGDDASATLKNLPAEVVDKIQVFDKLSDQSAWSGFDDGNAEKTLNIVTKRNRNQGIFGKIVTGAGLMTDKSFAKDPYQLNINLNYFAGKRRITFLGASNNINDQNFGSGDFLGGNPAFAGMRMLMGGGSSGITTTNALGLNYSDTLGKKVALSTSYFFSRGNSRSINTSDRTYISDMLPYKFFNQQNNSDNTSNNHRINLRLEYSINKNNSLIWTPRANIQTSNTSSITAQNFLNSSKQLYGSTYADNNGKANGINFSNELLYRHKFNKDGRTLSLGATHSISDRNRDTYIDNLLLKSVDTLKQYSRSLINGYNLSGSVVYTEPLSKQSQLQLNYTVSYAKNSSDKKTYNFDKIANDYTVFNDTLSSVYNSDYTTHRPGIGYVFKNKQVTFNAGVNYQYALLNGNQTYPVQASVKSKGFSSILPSLMLNYKFSDYMNLRAFYRSNSNAPSVNQLQQVVDNSNPMFLSTGNPYLQQEVRHMFNARFSLSNKAKTNNLFFMTFLTKTNNAIGNAMYYAANDTLVSGINLKKGGQLTIPVNLDGAWSARALVTYGFPLTFIKSNLNFNSGISYNNTPSQINGLRNLSKSFGLNEGVVLSSNVGPNLDFLFTYNFNYNRVKNTLQSKNDNNYIFQIASGNFRWQFTKKLFVQTNLTYQNYNTLATKKVTDYTLWNASVGSKLFKNNAGEIKLTAYDILKQNTSYNHNVTESYIEDVNSMTLQQYFMVTFTYNLRKFTGKAPQNMGSDNPMPWRDRRDGPPGM